MHTHIILNPRLFNDKSQDFITSVSKRNSEMDKTVSAVLRFGKIGTVSLLIPQVCDS